MEILATGKQGIISFHKELIHLYYQYIYRRPKLKQFFIGVASVYLFRRLSQLVSAMIPSIKRNLIGRYGENSWAVVTGGSDGIGKEFCVQLAKLGFNIAIIARNEQKMDDCAKLLGYGVQTKIIVADFSEGYTTQFYENIQHQLEQLDVSILVNNVGMSSAGAFQTQKMDELFKIIRVNALSSLMMTKILSKRMEERQHRSAVINISSGLAQLPCPFVSLYSASKAFTHYFTQSLGLTSQNIDFMSVTPLGVSTKMLAHKTGKEIITPQQLVTNVLNDLRKGFKVSYGCSIHKKTINYCLWRNENFRNQKKLQLGQYLMKTNELIQQQQKQ